MQPADSSWPLRLRFRRNTFQAVVPPSLLGLRGGLKLITGQSIFVARCGLETVGLTFAGF